MEKAKAKVLIEKVFRKLNFRLSKVGTKELWVHNNCYCSIEYIEFLSAFVVASTNNLKNAEKSLLEDGDLYFIGNITEKQLTQQVYKDLVFLIENDKDGKT